MKHTHLTNHGADIGATPAPDPYAELKAAHAAGKVIQFRFRDSEPFCDIGPDEECGGPSWKYPVEQYRIKPEPSFQLPTPPPGMQWHRTDGWKEGDLPQGWRPMCLGETYLKGDEWHLSSGWLFCKKDETIMVGPRAAHSRTTRPLTFTHAGKEWTWHKPGDPMPCDGSARIEVFWRTMPESADFSYKVRKASVSNWAKDTTVIGWRYAETKKLVELGPEDMKPFTVIRRKGEAQTWHWRTVSYVDAVKVTCGNRGYGWSELASDYERNESLTLTGKWNPDAWEPCSKEVAV